MRRTKVNISLNWRDVSVDPAAVHAYHWKGTMNCAFDAGPTMGQGGVLFNRTVETTQDPGCGWGVTLLVEHFAAA